MLATLVQKEVVYVQEDDCSSSVVAKLFNKFLYRGQLFVLYLLVLEHEVYRVVCFDRPGGVNVYKFIWELLCAVQYEVVGELEVVVLVAVNDVELPARKLVAVLRCVQ